MIPSPSSSKSSSALAIISSILFLSTEDNSNFSVAFVSFSNSLTAYHLLYSEFARHPALASMSDRTFSSFSS